MKSEQRPQHAFFVDVDRNLCYYCGACVAVCPPDSIFLENSHLKVDHQTCTRCERCIAMCPVHALSKAPLTPEVSHEVKL
ncbi:MAG: 4Fe-4S binding protein [Anaerolinea sp.]|nr:4Fe-4S binding protein [Anaerolinea sp.]MCC6976328.1 4Fe-4S binding protein [Anaerolineae bacterium]CAG1008162.1 2-oxoglutarate ferredoxin oxidoreductase subunit delta [Anaerolineae bacterium]